MRPLSTVEKPSFRKLIQGVSGTDLTFPSAKSIKDHMKTKYDNQELKLKQLQQNKNLSVQQLMHGLAMDIVI